MPAKIKSQISDIIKIALKEDGALDDVTSDLTLSAKNQIKFVINSREKIVFCGAEIITEVFSQLKKSAKFKNSKLSFKIKVQDGQNLKAQSLICQGFGEAKLIFAAERVILNLIQHLSGIATSAHQFVETLNNSKIKILDTRKTIP